MEKKTGLPCLCAAGVGARDTSRQANGAPCKMRDIEGRRALRCVWDRDGRWLIHWREEDGEEWCGTYRLLPC